MDRNTIIGFLLMILLVIGFAWFNTPSPEEAAEQLRLDSLARVEQEQKKALVAPPADKVTTPVYQNDSAFAQAMNAQFGILAPATNGEAKYVTIENNKIRMKLSTKGGMIKNVTLVDGYTRYKDNAAVELWADSLSKMKLNFTLAGKGNYSTDYFYFTPSATNIDAKAQAQDLVLRMNSADPSKYLELVYHIEPNSYDVSCKLNVVGLGNQMDLTGNSLRFEWMATGIANEKGITAERSKCGVYFREQEEDRDYLSESGDDVKFAEKALNWVAFKQDYFTAAVIAKEGFKAEGHMAVATLEDSSLTKRYYANLALPVSGDSFSSNLQFYFGPNDYKELAALEIDEFDRIIDYGWSIIGLINKYAVRPLFWFFSSFIGSFGLIILLVTLIIKMVLFPITWKNFLSSAKMRVLKPEIDEINKKYENKDQAMEKQSAIMALYRQTGVNPFAGCIPVLLQMPILYAMFRFFPAEIVLRGKSFLWADDLAAYDSIFSWSQNIPILSSVYGNHVSGWTLLMAASTFLYTRMSMQSQPQVQQPGMPNMSVMMNLFAFMMIFFFNNMPSGLSMYYFTANMISIGQMFVIKKYIIDENAIREKIEANKKKPKKKSNFSERLAQIQKEQQKKLDETKKKRG
ncbi:MAG: membrane protein insertase YidC [Flavobacteriales bacterium]